MRNLNLLIFLTTSLFWSPLFAQNLSMAQILELWKKSPAEAEEYLTTLGWEFYKTSKLGIYTNEMTFSYKIKDDVAESWITYHWDDFGINNKNLNPYKVQIHFFDSEKK